MVKWTAASTRVKLGVFLLVVATIVTVIGGFSFYNPDATMVSTMFTLGSGLVSAGLLIKKHRAFRKENSNERMYNER